MLGSGVQLPSPQPRETMAIQLADPSAALPAPAPPRAEPNTEIATQRLEFASRSTSWGGSRLHGFAFDVSAEHAVLLSALEIPLRRLPRPRTVTPRTRRSSPVETSDPVRVFVIHTQREPLSFDWRRWVPVGSKALDVAGSSSPGELMRVQFDVPVPIAAGATRTLYVYSPTGMSVEYGPRNATLCADGAIRIRCQTPLSNNRTGAAALHSAQASRMS